MVLCHGYYCLRNPSEWCWTNGTAADWTAVVRTSHVYGRKCEGEEEVEEEEEEEEAMQPQG